MNKSNKSIVAIVLSLLALLPIFRAWWRQSRRPPVLLWPDLSLLAAARPGWRSRLVHASRVLRVGFLVLATTTLAGLDLVRGNAVKVLSILIYTFIALGIFAWQGKVDWVLGLVLAAGTVLGSQLGVHLTVLKGHRWIKKVVTVMVILLAVKLLLMRING